MSRRPDRRSAQAAEYRKLYDLPEWRRPHIGLRDRKRADEPYCERCRANGFEVLMDVVNHRTPHRGDRALFLDWNNLESLCAPCHDQVVQAEERSGRTKPKTVGYHHAVGADGWPLDPRHPANRT